MNKEIFPYICSAIKKGAIAQLVEQRTENPCVPGSIPGGTTRKLFNKGFSVKIESQRNIFKGLLLENLRINSKMGF